MAGGATGRDSRVTPALSLAVLSLAVLAAYAVGLTRHGAGFSPVVDGWLSVAAALVPGLGCLLVARRPGPRRLPTALVGTGTVCWAAGDLVGALAASGSAQTPFPSFADVGFLLFDVCLGAALVVGVSRQGRGRGRQVWLDCATAALGIAAALALLLQPVLQGRGGSWAAVAVSVAYPFADLVLVAAVVGLAALLGLRVLREWLLFAVGLLLFAAADVVFALRSLHGTFVLGTPLDLLWLTRAVLELALDQARRWRDAGRQLRIAVNLSASSLVDAELPAEVARLLAARDLPSSVLQLEITEEFLMVDRDRARTILQQLRELGVQIAVDDFGTGYSSLAYLRELPVDELKLDRSFVLPMGGDARAAALVASVVELAHSLGLRIVAEGVEDAGALDALTGYGCDEAQGFHLSRPLPGEELDRWLRGRDRLLADQSAGSLPV